MAENDADETETFGLKVVVYPEDGQEIDIRTIGLGVQPLILIEAEEGEDGRVNFTVTASVVSRLEHVRDIVKLIDLLLEDAAEQQRSGRG